jgi:hypothetical protein
MTTRRKIMKRTSSRAAGALFLALAVLMLTGTALADNGNGNSANAPGQQKQADATPAAQPAPAAPASQPAPAAQPSSQAPGQAKKSTSSPSSQPSSTSSPGQAKQQAKASSSAPGVKPSSTTGKWTSCSTGTSGGSVTCTGNGPKADSSKQYGNGKTAAQIAASRGAPAGTKISGPGNSQPHKVTACGKPNNKSGGVDVHAVKSYDASACQTVTPACTANCSTPPTAPCGYSVTSQTTIAGVTHMNGQGQPVRVMTNPKSAHFQPKHGDTVAATQTTYSLAANGDSCGGSHESVTPGCTENCSGGNGGGGNGGNESSGSVLSANATLSGNAAPAGSSASATPNAGGVLGAQANLSSPKPHRGGVLGAVTNVAGSTLPFTGFPLWIAVLLAVVLIAAGLMLRGRGTASRL